MNQLFKFLPGKRVNVIWISSYPKSGSTWINTVLKRAGKDYGYPQGNNDVYKLSDKNEKPEICNAVKAGYANNPCIVLKTHSAYKKNSHLHKFRGLKFSNCGFIHVYRNPLDVLLSYINFSRKQYQNFENMNRGKREKYKKLLFIDMLGFRQPFDIDTWLNMSLDSIPVKNLDYALDYFSEHELEIKVLHTGLFTGSLNRSSGSWIRHIESWKSAHQDMKGFSMRYEDCLVDREQFAIATEFFEFQRDNIFNALENFNRRTRELASEGSIFYNKMQAYYFREYFSDAAIQRFLYKNEEILKMYGYGLLLDMK